MTMTRDEQARKLVWALSTALAAEAERSEDVATMHGGVLQEAREFLRQRNCSDRRDALDDFDRFLRAVQEFTPTMVQQAMRKVTPGTSWQGLGKRALARAFALRYDFVHTRLPDDTIERVTNYIRSHYGETQEAEGGGTDTSVVARPAPSGPRSRRTRGTPV
jgi:hypothetical protein